MAESDHADWRVTTDHDYIVDWAEDRDAVPVRVERADGETDLSVVSDPGDAAEPRLSWEEFFEAFEDRNLAFRYRADASMDRDHDACELVDRESVEGLRDAAQSVADPDRQETETMATGDTGDAEPVVHDELEDDASADETTAMSESPRGAEDHALVLDEIHETGALGSGVDDEYLVFENDGEGPIDLSGAVVENDAGRSFAFPEGFTLEPGQRVTLHSGDGTDDEANLYWGASEPVWDDTGDTVTVRTPSGQRLLREPYKSG